MQTLRFNFSLRAAQSIFCVRYASVLWKFFVVKSLPEASRRAVRVPSVRLAPVCVAVRSAASSLFSSLTKLACPGTKYSLSPKLRHNFAHRAMDLLVRRLQLKLQQHPDNQILQQTLTRLSAAGRSTLDDGTRDAVVRDLEGLRADGVLDADDFRIFQELQGDSSRSTSGSVLPTRHAQNTSHDRYGLPSTSQHDAERFRYIQANLADTTVPLASFLPGTSTYLPVELVELLNQTYFLHILATEPDKALPPGKSLLSVLSRPREAAQSEKSALEEQVETMVHAAFWEEVCV